MGSSLSLYCEKRLTKPTDKLIALTGLANLFHQHLPNDRYVAGMWRFRLPQSLIWEVGTGSRTVTNTAVATSSSWALIDEQVQKRYIRSVPPEDKVRIIVDVQAEPSILELGKDVYERKLTVFRCIRRITICDNHGEDGHTFYPPIWNLRRDLVIYHGQLQVRINKSSPHASFSG